MGYVAQRAGVAAADVLAADLMTHDLTPSALIGASVNGTASLLSAPRLDNQASCYAGMEALLAVDVDSASSGFVPVLAIFDHEEVGSASATAHSPICYPACSNASCSRRAAPGRTSCAD